MVNLPNLNDSKLSNNTQHEHAQRVLILGASSIIGWSLYQNIPGALGHCNLKNKEKRAKPLLRANIDDVHDIHQLIQDVQPDLLIHAAGICNVSKCERDKDWARRINIEGTKHILAAIPDNCRLCYCSSDHVFGAGSDNPLYEDSPVAPISFYGEGRVRSEELVLSARSDALIVRIGLCIGDSLDGRTGHLDWLRSRSQKQLPLTLIEDEFRHAVSAAALAKRILDLDAVGTEILGQNIVHICSNQLWDRPSLAKKLATKYHLNAQLTQRCRAVHSRKVQLPHIGRLDLASHLNQKTWPTLTLL